MQNKHIALWFSLVCIIVFIIQVVIPGFTDALILNKSSIPEVWRFVTAIFLHGSLSHLLYNMFALALFGSILEGLVGTRKFLLVFFTSGIFANIISVNYYSSSLGASGAIYGIFGFLVIIRPMMTIWLYGLPMPMFIAGILWVAGAILGLFTPSNIGHIAHLSGIIIGLIFGIIFRSQYRQIKIQGTKLRIDESTIKSWEDAYLR